tara:strand:+ start:207 stop:536 length:330 start_codon:yes stop_codon:yes gene_type:complete
MQQGELKMSEEIEFSINGLEENIFTDADDEFVKYVHGFYGKGGIYAEEFFPPNGVTQTEIVLAVKIRKLMNIDFPFHGDSGDREIVRDIMAQARLVVITLKEKRGTEDE